MERGYDMYQAFLYGGLAFYEAKLWIGRVLFGNFYDKYFYKEEFYQFYPYWIKGI